MRLGKLIEVPLIKNGQNTPVTKENLYQYLILLANYKLNMEIEKQSDHFRAGLLHLIPSDLLSMFNQVILINEVL